MFKRMQTALSSLITQLERYKIDSEIILVDYNPPPDHSFLKDSLSWPVRTEYCSIRTIVVPPEFHRKFKDSEKIPFYGSLAQNVGIRRARGQFVLATPVDILFTNEIIEFISGKKLEQNKLYRTDRLDVARQAVDIASHEERLNFCRDNITFIHMNRGCIPIVRKGKKNLSSRNLKSTGKFPDSKIMWKLHFNGGDFTLMSKDAWNRICGWPEDDVLSVGAEIVLYCMAYLNGIKEDILQPPYSIFHIEHNSRWISGSLHPFVKFCYYFLPDEYALQITSILRPVYTVFSRLINRKEAMLDLLGVDYKTFAQFKEITGQMMNGERPSVFNKADWGLCNESLSDNFIVKSAWENDDSISISDQSCIGELLR
jgi:hypothetical protein